MLRVLPEDAAETLPVLAYEHVVGEAGLEPAHGRVNQRRNVRVGNLVIHPAPLLSPLHKPRLAEDAQMPGDGRGSQVQQFDDLADALLTARKREERANATLVGQRAGNRKKVGQ